jgi:hypothetical protein
MLVILAVVVIALVLGGWILSHRRGGDGPGSTREVTLQQANPKAGCLNPEPIKVGDHYWSPTGPGSKAWTGWRYPVHGTLRIVTSTTATFTADGGGSMPFARTSSDQLLCAIQ